MKALKIWLPYGNMYDAGYLGVVNKSYKEFQTKNELGRTLHHILPFHAQKFQKNIAFSYTFPKQNKRNLYTVLDDLNSREP